MIAAPSYSLAATCRSAKCGLFGSSALYSPPPWNDFGHAVEVRSMTAEDIEHFEQALAAWDGEYESESYEGLRGLDCS